MCTINMGRVYITLHELPARYLSLTDSYGAYRLLRVLLTVINIARLNRPPFRWPRSSRLVGPEHHCPLNIRSGLLSMCVAICPVQFHGCQSLTTPFFIAPMGLQECVANVGGNENVGPPPLPHPI